MTELEKKSRELPVESSWDYARRSGGARHRLDRRALRPVRRRRVGRAASGEWYTTISPATEEPLAEVAQAAPEDVRLAVDAARAAYENGWSALPGSERAKYLFRISRVLQERAREFAVLESLNGGKPIRESRDVDLPLAAAHFFYYAGWADKLEYAFPNRAPRSLGVAGQIIPWNFPLLMLAWKIAPALATGNTVVLKPAETTPLTALLFCDVLRQAELPPASSTSSRATAARARTLVKRGRRQDRLHGLDRGRQGDPAPARRHRQAADARARRQGGEHRSSTTRRSTRRSRGSSTASTSTRATCAAPGSRLLVQESVYEDVIRKLKRRMGTLRVGDPLDKNTDVGAINSRQQLDKITELVEGGRGGGRRDLPAAVPAAGEGLLVRADGLHRRRAELPDRAGGDLRPRALGADVPDAGRGGREGEQHAVRAVGGSLDGEGLADPLDGASGCGPASSGRTRSTASIRRRRSAATRSPASAARAAATGSSPTSRWTTDDQAARQEDVQALHRGRVPALRVGALVEVEGQNVARASRKDLRDAVRAARTAFPGWAGRPRTTAVRFSTAPPR